MIRQAVWLAPHSNPPMFAMNRVNGGLDEGEKLIESQTGNAIVTLIPIEVIYEFVVSGTETLIAHCIIDTYLCEY